jgi:hypothetical protein
VHFGALVDKTRSGEFVDERTIHLPAEIKVKGVERALGIAIPSRHQGVDRWFSRAYALPG